MIQDIDCFSIERKSQINPAGWSVLSIGKLETNDHGPDFTSIGGLLINEPPKPTFFSTKSTKHN